MAKGMTNLFISHIHEDDAKLSDLMSLASKKGMSVRNYSITSDKPNNARSERYIKRLLSRHIKPCSTFLVYITPQTRDSKWVNWEIEHAARKGKRIVGVWAYGAAGCAIPTALEKHHHALVGWNGGNIVRAIDGRLNKSYNYEGQPRPQRTDIKFGGCR